MKREKENGVTRRKEKEKKMRKSTLINVKCMKRKLATGV